MRKAREKGEGQWERRKEREKWLINSFYYCVAALE